MTFYPYHFPFLGPNDFSLRSRASGAYIATILAESGMQRASILSINEDDPMIQRALSINTSKQFHQQRNILFSKS